MHPSGVLILRQATLPPYREAAIEMLSTWINHLTNVTPDQCLSYFNVFGHPHIWTARGDEHLIFALQGDPLTGQLCEQYDQVLRISNTAAVSDGFIDNLRASGVISLVQCCGWQILDPKTPCNGPVSTATFVPDESRTCLDHTELEYLLQVWSFGSGISALASPRGLQDRPFVFGGQQHGWTDVTEPEMQKAVERLNKNWPEETWTLTAGTISMGPSGQLTDCLELALTRTATHIVRTFANRMRWTLIEPIGQFCPKSLGISCCPPGPLFRVYKCELRATLQHDAAFHFVQQLEQGQVIHLFQQSGLQLHWSETQTGEVQLKVQYESSFSGTHLEDDFLACLFRAYCSESSRQWTITHPGPLVPASIRLVNKCKVNFEMPCTIQVSDLQSLWEMACRWVGRSPEIRWICGARNRTLTCPIVDCIHQGKIMFYHVVRLHGGGRKQDKVVETKTQLASWMALEGIKVEETMRIIETLHSKAGLPQLQHILGIQVADRWNALELLCRKVDEPLPVPHKGPPIPKTKPSKIVSSAPDTPTYRPRAADHFVQPNQ